MTVRFSLLAIAIAGSTVAQPALDATQGTQKTVDSKALEAFLPAPAGWTKGAIMSDRISISDGADYTYASAPYTNGNAKVKITVADSGGNADSLMTLVAMVVLFPDDYSEQVDPTTLVKRFLLGGFPAASRWDSKRSEGELGVLVAKRFCARAEGEHLAGPDVLRPIIEQIDLKKLAELK